MANNELLKTSIRNVIKANGNREITGDIMQQTLVAIVDALGKGYQFMGIATPTTDPGTTEQKVFYIATDKGVYTNFGGINIDEDGVFLLIYDGAWTKLLVTNAANLDKIIANSGYLKKSALASVLTAVTIDADNTPQSMQANVTNLAAYIANLQSLGVTNDNGIMIPFHYMDPEICVPFAGLLIKFGGWYNGIVPDLADTGQGVKFISISGEGKVTFKKLAYESA